MIALEDVPLGATFLCRCSERPLSPCEADPFLQGWVSAAKPNLPEQHRHGGEPRYVNKVGSLCILALTCSVLPWARQYPEYLIHDPSLHEGPSRKGHFVMLRTDGTLRAL